MKFLIIVAVVCLLIYVIVKRNKFVSMKETIQESIDTIGSARSQLETNIQTAMSIAKVACEKEVGALHGLTTADQMHELKVLGERFPSLTVGNNYTKILNDCGKLHAEIKASQDVANSNIRIYNTQVQAFPALIVAAIFGFKRMKTLDESNTASNREIKRVELDYSQF